MSGLLAAIVGSLSAPTPVSFANQFIDDYNFFGGGGSSATIRFKSNGSYEKQTNSAGIVSYGNWCNPPGNASLYEIRATVASGLSVTGSATASWLALTADRAWTLTRILTGIHESVLTVEVRRASDGVVMDSATITLYLENFEDPGGGQ